MSSPKHRKNTVVSLRNKEAYFHYQIEEDLIAGMVLMGSEIKSIRASRVSFNDSYCYFQRGELWIKSLHIAPYENSGYLGHEPRRDRKLLITKKEIKKWQQKIKEKGFTIVPLSIFIDSKGLAKLKVGLGRGKKVHDKRASIKERDAKRALQQIKI